jgi:hypothetical protein
MGPNTPDPALTGIAMAYTNEAMVADEVLPRLLPLGKQEFKWNLWDLGNRFTIPDTKIARKAEATEVEFASTEQTDSTLDYGLDDAVPIEDIDNAPPGVDPEGNAVENLTDLVMLDREQRVANTVFALATYPAANRKTITGTDQWNDKTNSDPINEIGVALDVPIMRPNIGVIGRVAWTQLRSHPKILQAVNAIGGDTAGMATRAAVAELLELEELIVGAAWVNTAKPGQTPTVARLWGKHMALLHRNRLVTTPGANRITFGFTAQYRTRVAWRREAPKRGLYGSIEVRSGESVKEVIAANDVAYFLQNVVA